MKQRLALRSAMCLSALLLPLAAFGLEIGEKAPPFANPDRANRHVLSRDFLGKNWLIVDFFATDCEGCKKELPILERLSRDFLATGLKVLVFATDTEGQSLVEPYFRQNPTTLTVLLDRYQTTVKRYGVSEIPSLFLIDPAGVILYKEVGFKEDLYDQVQAVLAGKR